MLRKKASLTLIVLLAAGIIWNFPSNVQAEREPHVLIFNVAEAFGGVINVDGQQVQTKTKGNYFQSYYTLLGYALGVDFKEATNLATFDREFKSGEFNLISFEYHGLQDNPDLQQWIDDNADAIKTYVEEGGFVVYTGGRDAADIPLVKIVAPGLAESLGGFPVADKCCIGILPDTPLTKDMADILDTSKSTDPTFVGDGNLPGYEIAKLPAHANVAGDLLDDPAFALIVYGRIGKGGYVFSGSAEIVNLAMGFGVPEMSEDSHILWRNILNWASDAILSVEPADKLSTTWGRIKASRY
jgi:hypothetical protein